MEGTREELGEGEGRSNDINLRYIYESKKIRMTRYRHTF